MAFVIRMFDEDNVMATAGILFMWCLEAEIRGSHYISGSQTIFRNIMIPGVENQGVISFRDGCWVGYMHFFAESLMV